ncbi:hypothetical protein [Sphingobium fuliginis]|uniref:Uncharacterized protein n=2 Tax=Sphingobium fuliginis (strain ATCC 27551) TaxID=336203 RepID=A0A292ZMV2_SPHSA|nr:hypothetical protein [Sphingobium fuliginis]QDC39988.1 hypothetical protein FIL70_22915 [Sphingobium fuliginis ATCC 27551]GAY24190.1 hypothetical protein SFOMI_4770 [Sphingobium fuliginis]
MADRDWKGLLGRPYRGAESLRNAWLTAKAMNAFSEGRVGSANGLITYVAMPYFNDAVSPAG